MAVILLCANSFSVYFLAEVGGESTVDGQIDQRCSNTLAYRQHYKKLVSSRGLNEV